MGRVHQGLEHVPSAHPASQQGENQDEQGQKDDGLNSGTADFFHFHGLGLGEQFPQHRQAADVEGILQMVFKIV